MVLLLEQCLNGLQLGLLLFLLAAGLTLVFGIMDLVNLAHGSLYMMGAYFAATFAAWTGSFLLGSLLALGATLLLGMALEVIAMRRLYGRGHLDQLLGTFGLILFFNELVRLIWGPAGRSLPLPDWLNGPVHLLPGLDYPAYRLVIIVTALGVNIGLLCTFVFGLGAVLAALAGLLRAPIQTVQIGMGENILILGFVVIVIGGIGSIRGAFVAALLVGLVDTVGRAFLPELLRLVLTPHGASAIAPALSSMLIYLVMAAVLVLRPEGLYPASSR
jgi:branched-chain amino acid transport system permease protein